MNWDDKLNLNTTLMLMEWSQKESGYMNGRIWCYTNERKTDWFN